MEGIVSEFPMCGNRQMPGHVLARGIRFQQHRIREAQRRVDPAGTVMRRLRTIQRRDRVSCEWPTSAMAHRWQPQIDQVITKFTIIIMTL